MRIATQALPLCAALLALPACGEGAPTVHDAWIREAPPGATTLAGYARVHNVGATTLRCDRVSGPDFGAAELHRTVIENGMARMLRAQVVELAPGTEASLVPGGLHLMLFRPTRELRAGAMTRLTLHCGERQINADFQVKAAP